MDTIGNLYNLRSQRGYTWVFLALLYLVFIGKFFVTKTGLSSPPLVNYVFLLFVLMLSFSSMKKYGQFIILYFAIFIIYFLFKYISSGLPFVSSVINYLTCFEIFLLITSLLMFLDSSQIKIDVLRRHFYILYTFEVFLGILQYVFPPILEFCSIDSYTWNGVTVEMHSEGVVSSTVYVIGTFFKQATYANVMSIATALVIIDFFYNRTKLLSQRVVLLLLGFITIVLTGIRTPFLMLGFVLLLIVYKKKREWLIWILILLVFFVVIFLNSNILDEQSPVYRMQSGLTSVFSGDSSMLMEETIGYSLFMIPYFLMDPLFGVSYGDNYRIGILDLEDFSSTDVQFMFILCEIGIVGFLIFVWPLVQLFRQAGHKNLFRYVFPVLLLCLLLTIVDDTLFGCEAKMLYALSFVLFFKLNMETSVSYTSKYKKANE